MNQAFSDYVTSASFSLTITKGQIFALKCMVKNDYDTLLEDGRFVMYMQGLHRRGLVIHDPNFNPIEYPEKRAWSVTKAGELAYLLCEEAGLINT